VLRINSPLGGDLEGLLLRSAEIIFLLVIGNSLVNIVFTVANINLVALKVTNPGSIAKGSFNRINPVMIAKFIGTYLVNNGTVAL
jgi:hypothetical protein